MRFLIPEVLGLGAWAEISSTSAQTRDGLFTTLGRMHRQLSGQWFGVELVLYLQPAKARPLGADGKRLTSRFWALAVRSPYSITDLIDARLRLASIQPPAPLPALNHGDIERDFELSPALWGTSGGAGSDIRQVIDSLPVAPRGNDLRTRDEPAADDRADDTLLNRIAVLRRQVGLEAADALLDGAFGSQVERMNAATASAYAAGLERILATHGERVDDASVEVVVDEED
jgi:hypothetical protein